LVQAHKNEIDSRFAVRIRVRECVLGFVTVAAYHFAALHVALRPASGAIKWLG
jgi:hypothetical protein